MFQDDDPQAELRLHLPEEAHERPGGPRVEVGGGLVKNKHAGTHGEHGREGDALLFAPG